MKEAIIFIAASSLAEARKIAGELVERRLAACVNIIPKIESIYTWKGKTETANEILMVVKTKDALFDKVARMVKNTHSYECPEIIAFPIKRGNKDYLRWIEESTV